MKVKENYFKRLEDDLEFELGYLEWLEDNKVDQDPTSSIELDHMEIHRLLRSHGIHHGVILAKTPVNNQDYNPKLGA